MYSIGLSYQQTVSTLAREFVLNNPQLQMRFFDLIMKAMPAMEGQSAETTIKPASRAWLLSFFNPNCLLTLPDGYDRRQWLVDNKMQVCTICPCITVYL